MHRFAKLLSFFLLLCATARGAFIPAQGTPGNISVEGEWIYFSPSSETKYFGVLADPTNGVINGQRIANRFDDFHSGYRLATSYSFCNCDRFISVTWTQLKATKSRTVDIDTGLFPTELPAMAFFFDTFSFANQLHKLSYCAIDAILGQKAICTCWFDCDFFVGIHYANLKTKDRYTYLNFGGASFLLGNEKSNFWGIGPEIGFHTDMQLWHCLSLAASVSGSFLAGRPCSNISFMTNAPISTNIFATFNERAWRLVPYGDIRISAKYEFHLPRIFSCSGIGGTFEVGYETLAYFNALSNIKMTETISALNANSFDHYRNVTMYGPFVACTLSF